MLNKIKKEFQKIFNEKEATMKKDETVQLDLSAPTQSAQLAEAMATLASQSEALAAVTTKMTELQAMYEAAQTALAASQEAQATLVADASAKRLAARTEAVVASVGTVKADALLAATNSLDDAQFEAIVGAMATNFELEAKSEMFKEVGVSSPADTEKVVEAAAETAEGKLLRKKYARK